MSTIFNSSPITNDYSWTIVSKFGDILKIAETKYGERDKSYTLLGIELTTGDVPQIWYPGDCKNVIIQITSDCLNNLNKAVYQVAHEAIHCLYPSGNNVTNYLDEGLATFFSIEYAESNGHGTWYSGDPKYDEALDLVKQLLKLDDSIIKKLRQFEPSLCRVTVDILVKANQSIPQKLASELTKKF